MCIKLVIATGGLVHTFPPPPPGPLYVGGQLPDCGIHTCDATMAMVSVLETGQTPAPWPLCCQAPCSQCLCWGHSLTSDLLQAVSKPPLSFPVHLRRTPAFSAGFGFPFSRTFTELPPRDAESKDFFLKKNPSFILLTSIKCLLLRQASVFWALRKNIEQNQGFTFWYEKTDHKQINRMLGMLGGNRCYGEGGQAMQ